MKTKGPPWEESINPLCQRHNAVGYDFGFEHFAKQGNLLPRPNIFVVPIGFQILLSLTTPPVIWFQKSQSSFFGQITKISVVLRELPPCCARN